MKADVTSVSPRLSLEPVRSLSDTPLPKSLELAKALSVLLRGVLHITALGFRANGWLVPAAQSESD